MARLSALHFHPQRIKWIGFCLLGVWLLLVFPSHFLMHAIESPDHFRKSRTKEISASVNDFSLGLKNQNPVLPLPNLEGAITFSFDPPRPDQMRDGKRLMVRMYKSADTRKVFLPCRIDLAFAGENLIFAEENSPLWVELALNNSGTIECKAFIRTIDNEELSVASFEAKPGETPVQGAHEFSQTTPFQILAACKWRGKDQFRIDSSGERLEFPNGTLLELNKDEWLVFRDGEWNKCSKLEKEHPIARIRANEQNALILEGWDENGHLRLSIPYIMGPPLKIKAEELFSSVRIRSEKQISCIMEKQCLVLKVSDWVLKSGTRWKVLRKQEEREAYLNGELLGELFVLDQIGQKQGQKVIHGRLFNSLRSQVQNIELASTVNRKNTSGQRGKV